MSTARNRMKMQTKSDKDVNHCDQNTEPSDLPQCLWVVQQSLASLDSNLSKSFSVCARPDSPMGHLRPLMKALEISCHGIPWLLGTIVFLLSSYKAKQIQVLMNLLFGLLLDLAVVVVLKAAVRRPRPADNAMDMFATVSVDKFSFPSGHATRAAMMACFFIDNVLTSRLLMVAVILWSVSVTMSRVFLGRHHFSDIICGFVIGGLQYVVLAKLWLSQETCVDWLEPFHGHFHM